MGWMAEQHKKRRKRIAELVRKGFTNGQLKGQGYSLTVVSSVRKELDIPSPCDTMLTRKEIDGSRMSGRLMSPVPRRRKRVKWEEIRRD